MQSWSLSYFMDKRSLQTTPSNPLVTGHLHIDYINHQSIKHVMKRKLIRRGKLVGFVTEDFGVIGSKKESRIWETLDLPNLF
jgi:hypothetical protein